MRKFSERTRNYWDEFESWFSASAVFSYSLSNFECAITFFFYHLKIYLLKILLEPVSFHMVNALVFLAQ